MFSKTLIGNKYSYSAHDIHNESSETSIYFFVLNNKMKCHIEIQNFSVNISVQVNIVLVARLQI